jgi:hypothetical protein
MRLIILFFISIVSQGQNLSNISQLPGPYEYNGGGFNFIKYPSYLIGVNNGASQIEFYPPKVFYEGTNDFKVLGKITNQGYRSTSTDGISWATTSLTIPAGTGGDWDLGNAAPTVFLKDGSTYKALYSGWQSSPNYNYKIGYSSTSNFNSGWTKAGSYVYDVTDYNTANGTTWQCIQCSDAVLVGTTWYYFGIVFNNNLSGGSLAYGVGSPGGNFETVKIDTKICDFSTLNESFSWGQGISVFKKPITGEWYMTMDLGTLTYSTSLQNRSIYVFKSGRTDLPIFETSDFQSVPIMRPDISKEFENNFNYNSGWLKDNEGNLVSVGGNYHFYYGGHQNKSTPYYTGVMCLATINSIP